MDALRKRVRHYGARHGKFNANFYSLKKGTLLWVTRTEQYKTSID